MNAPGWFLKELKAFDPDLRLRWSRRLELWQLERKVTRSLHPGTMLNDSWRDDWIRAQDGYILVASIPPRGLSRYVFTVLRANDLWSNGGWKRVADQLDDFDREQEETKWQRFSEIVKDHSKDLYNMLALREGRLVYNVGVPQ